MLINHAYVRIGITTCVAEANMAEFDPIVNIAIVLTAALVGGMIAHRLRQPLILGYLLVGIAVGPYGFGLIGDLELIEILATIGVALLMFTLGLEISFSQLRQVGKVGTWGGIAQILATFALGLAAGKLLFHWSLTEAAFFGLLISLSSTMVCLKILMERGELDSVHGRIMIAILIVQDLSVVLMMVAVPVFGAPVQSLLSTLAIAAGKTLLFLGITVVLGLWVLPWLLGRVAGVKSRELFLLTVIILCFGAAFSTYIFGLSVAFGAFVVGLLLKQSRFAHQALSEITPLRDIFATLFFVSLGMLLSPRFVIENWSIVISLVVVIIVIKSVVCFGIVRLFGHSSRTALFVAAGLIQTGEFSFILAQVGADTGVMSDYFYSLIIASTIITMLLTPLLMSLASTLYPKLSGGLARRTLVPEDHLTASQEELAQSYSQVVICGHGRVGQNIARALNDLEISFSVIEIDPDLISKLRCNGEACIYGDASNFHVLHLAKLDKAKVLVVTYPDPLAAITTVKNALRINPRLEVIARIHRNRELELLNSLGVSELVSPEYEASLEFIRRTLASVGWNKDSIQHAINKFNNDEDVVEFCSDDES